MPVHMCACLHLHMWLRMWVSGPAPTLAKFDVSSLHTPYLGWVIVTEPRWGVCKEDTSN